METTISENELQLSRGRLQSLFLRYALPGVGAMLFLAMQSIADGLIVGRLIGATALAAVNIVIPIYTLVTAVALMIGVGTQAQMGIRMGQSDYTGAKTALISGLIGLIFFTVTATIEVNIFLMKLLYSSVRIICCCHFLRNIYMVLCRGLPELAFNSFSIIHLRHWGIPVSP